MTVLDTNEDVTLPVLESEFAKRDGVRPLDDIAEFPNFIATIPGRAASGAADVQLAELYFRDVSTREFYTTTATDDWTESNQRTVSATSDYTWEADNINARIRIEISALPTQDATIRVQGASARSVALDETLTFTPGQSTMYTTTTGKFLVDRAANRSISFEPTGFPAGTTFAIDFKTIESTMLLSDDHGVADLDQIYNTKVL